MAFSTEEQRAALAAAQARLAEVTGVLSAPTEHAGTDPDGLARATVDGSGQVTGVEFAPAVQQVPAEYVAAAVVAALDAAEAQRVDAITGQLGGTTR